MVSSRYSRYIATPRPLEQHLNRRNVTDTPITERLAERLEKLHADIDALEADNAGLAMRLAHMEALEDARASDPALAAMKRAHRAPLITR